METIADLNNFAVSCIDANKLKEAIDSLVQALHLTRNQFYHELGSTNDEGESGSCHSPSSTCHVVTHEATLQRPLTTLQSFTAPTRHDSIPTTMVTNEHVRHSRERDFHQIQFTYSSERKYNQPFVAFQQLDEGRETKDLMTDLSKSERKTPRIQLSAIVIFNCALCHDQLAQSVSSSTTRQVLRSKAFALYQNVIDLYFEESDSGMSGEDEMMTNSLVSSRPIRPGFMAAQQDMIVMAAVNNLVQLHHESSQRRKNYSHLMMALVDMLQRADYGCEEIKRQVDAQARVFVSNTVLSWSLDLEIAAVAA